MNRLAATLARATDADRGDARERRAERRDHRQVTGLGEAVVGAGLLGISGLHGLIGAATGDGDLGPLGIENEIARDGSRRHIVLLV